MNQGTQAELLARAQSGDREALEALLSSVQPQLYRFSLKMCRHNEDAEDVLQDAMIAIAKSVKGFRGDGSLSTWLFSITRSFCIKKRRRSKFAPKQEESFDGLVETQTMDLSTEIPSPDVQLESREIWQQVHAAIREIEPAYREILVLRDIEGLSAKEVAEVVDLTVPAVKSRLHRARAQLRTLLAENPYRPASGCPDIRQVFSHYLEGELSQDVCHTMQSHVMQCITCARECEGLKLALNACVNAPAVVPSTVQNRVKAGLRRAIEGTL